MIIQTSVHSYFKTNKSFTFKLNKQIENLNVWISILAYFRVRYFTTSFQLRRSRKPSSIIHRDTSRLKLISDIFSPGDRYVD